MRQNDAEAVNAIANADDVRSMMFLGALYPPQHLDFEPYMADKRNVFLEYAGFAAIFIFRGPTVYECHIMARKTARGSNAFAVGREMLAYMKEVGAKTIWGQPSIYNRAAICYIRRMGLKPVGFGVDLVAGEVQYFEMEI